MLPYHREGLVSVREGISDWLHEFAGMHTPYVCANPGKQDAQFAQCAKGV